MRHPAVALCVGLLAAAAAAPFAPPAAAALFAPPAAAAPGAQVAAGSGTPAVAAVPPTFLLVAAPSPAPAATASAPTVILERAEVAPGQPVRVRLTGWPAGTVVVELCAADTGGCAVDSSVQTHLPATGAGGVSLPVAVPPGGCPCQVRVTTLDRRLTAAVPLTLTGAASSPTPPTVAQATAPPRVTAVAVELDRSWWSRLGGPSRHTLVVRLRNDAPAPAAVTMSVTVGRGDDPSGFVNPPNVPDLAAGEEREVRVPVRLPALAFGTWTIDGRVVTAGVAAPFRAALDSRPWGPTALLGIVVAAVAVGLLRPTGRRDTERRTPRHRRTRRRTDPPSQPPPSAPVA